jgi:hypothetical protein
MGLNLISPSVFTTAILIGDTVHSPNGGTDSTPVLTTTGNPPITGSTCLELQSTTSALLVSRMTTTQRNALNAIDGMLVYDTTVGAFFMREGGAWNQSGPAGGDVIGPAVSVAGDIAIFADTTGKVLADSGVPITKVPQLAEVLELREKKGLTPLINVNQIGNLGHIAFTNGIGLLFVDSLMPVEFIDNDYGPGNQVCSLFTGGLPSSSTTPSALIELQTTTGAFLLSRMTTVQKNALTSPAAGMMVYDTTIGDFSFYNGAWFEIPAQTIANWTDVTSGAQALLANNGYVTDLGGGVTYTLPATANLGDQIMIVGKSGISTIDQNANQQITIASASSTVGVGGSVNGNNAGDCITLVCITAGASTVWRANSVIGNWTVT